MKPIGSAMRSSAVLTLPSLATILITLLSASSVGLAEWPQFRGPGGQGVANATNLPVSWSDRENMVWKRPLPGYGASSPVILGDRIYLTCYSGYGTAPEQGLDELTLHVVCMGVDGTSIWEKKIAPKQPESERVRDHGYAAPTPATDGEHLYVFFGKSGVFKFDLDGNQKWQALVGDGLHDWGCGTSPVLYDDLVIVNASVESRSLVAIHKNTGEEAWRASGMVASWNTPHLVSLPNGRSELVVSVKEKILGFDPGTGEQLWSCDGIQDYVCPSIVSQQGIVYVIGGRTSRAIAVRAGGRGDVTQSHILWDAKAGANVVSPVIYQGHLYWVSDRNKIAYCLRLSDGEVVYAERFPGQPYASTLVGDGKLYVVTRSDGTYVLAARPEFEQLAHNRLSDRSTFNASPVATNNRLYLRSDKFLYCIAFSD